jgi:hypothetical protein
VGAQEDEVFTVKETMAAPLNAQLQSIGLRETKLMNHIHQAEHKVCALHCAEADAQAASTQVAMMRGRVEAREQEKDVTGSPPPSCRAPRMGQREPLCGAPAASARGAYTMGW